MTVSTVHSLAGQAVRGEIVTTPWTDGSFEVTQGWGTTDVTLEPAGHGHPYWHAGADLGMPCGTLLKLPAGMGRSGRAQKATTAKWIDNPGGYGTGLIIKLGYVNLDIYLGHLRQRLVADGQILRDGDHLALTNSTGSSTGCHLHFEVRPMDARYGTDIDPSSWLLDPSQGAVSTEPTPAPFDPLGIQSAMSAALSQGLAMGQVGLGGTMMASGLIVAAYGLRGQSMAQLQGDAGRTWHKAVQRPLQRRRADTAAREAGEATAERKYTRDMTPEELERHRAGEGVIPEAVKRRQKGRRIVDPNDPRVRARAERNRPDPGIDVEAGLARVRAARLSRVRPSHQKARQAVLRDARGQVIPF